jgi:hypothetical protein
MKLNVKKLKFQPNNAHYGWKVTIRIVSSVVLSSASIELFMLIWAILNNL